MLQFYYGEDGIDPTQTGCLKTFPFLFYNSPQVGRLFYCFLPIPHAMRIFSSLFPPVLQLATGGCSTLLQRRQSICGWLQSGCAVRVLLFPSDHVHTKHASLLASVMKLFDVPANHKTFPSASAGQGRWVPALKAAPAVCLGQPRQSGTRAPTPPRHSARWRDGTNSRGQLFKSLSDMVLSLATLPAHQLHHAPSAQTAA